MLSPDVSIAAFSIPQKRRLNTMTPREIIPIKIETLLWLKEKRRPTVLKHKIQLVQFLPDRRQNANHDCRCKLTGKFLRNTHMQCGETVQSLWSVNRLAQQFYI
jgi:hypothetical protein